MKLRIRSLETKEALRIEVPNSFSLQHLKDVILHSISSSSSSKQSQKPQTIETQLQKEPGLDTKTLEFELWDGEIKPEEDKNLDVDDDRWSAPSFLRRVLGKEVVGDGGSGFQLLVIAVHAVFLDSGFVRVDPVSKTILDGFNPLEWPSSSFNIVLSYSLPEIISSVGSGSVESVALKFVSLGKFLHVYGFPGSYHVYLDKDQLVPFLNAVCPNCEKRVLEFWKSVKDKIALPLLIDLCEKTGLAPPPSFMRLPMSLQYKILESVTGVDLAKVACVCSELHLLSLDDDLWKQKFVEEFGNVCRSEGNSNWKDRFAGIWESRKRNWPSYLNPLGVVAMPPPPPPPQAVLAIPPPPPAGQAFYRYDNPLGFSGFIGGDYYHLPVLPVLANPPPPGPAYHHYQG